ncbi:MAG: cytidine deaminase [Pseudomonadota bacterium]
MTACLPVPDDLQTTMFEMAREAMTKSHSPYSEFPVGVCLRTSSGALFSGCNIENASYPEGWCAETTAIGHMIMAGEKSITHMLVVAKKQDSATPCGGCRQRLSEFAASDAVLMLCDQNGVVSSHPFTSLFPSGFSLSEGA